MNHKVMHLIGDVKIVIVSLSMTWLIRQVRYVKTADALKQFGARRVIAYQHPCLSGKSLDNLRNSVIDELVVTDTIPLSDEALNLGKIRQVSICKTWLLKQFVVSITKNLLAQCSMVIYNSPAFF